MAFLYEYMSPDELAYAKEEAQIMNESVKLDHALECLRMEHAIRLSNIDTECLVQEYTQDDLESMYMNEMHIYTEGVKEWWDKFVKWITNIVHKIFGKKDVDEEVTKSNDEVTAPYNPDKANEILDKAKGLVSSITDVQNDDGSLNMGKLVPRLALGGAAGAGLVATIKAAAKPVKMKLSELWDKVVKNMNKTQELAKAVEGMTPEDGEAGEKKARGIKELVSGVVTTVNGWVNSVMGLFKKKDKNPESETPNDKENSTTDSKNQDTPKEQTEDSSKVKEQNAKEEGKPETPDAPEDTTPKKNETPTKVEEPVSDSKPTTMKIEDIKSKFTDEESEGWKILMDSRGKKNKGKITKLSEIEGYLSRISNPDRKAKAVKAVEAFKRNGVTDDTILEFSSFDYDIGYSIMESMEDPFNFMESGTEVTGNLKDFSDLLDQL